MGIVARTLSSHEPFHYLGPCVESPRETLREERSLGPGGSSCLWGKSRRPPPEDIRCSEKCSGTERKKKPRRSGAASIAGCCSRGVVNSRRFRLHFAFRVGPFTDRVIIKQLQPPPDGDVESPLARRRSSGRQLRGTPPERALARSCFRSRRGSTVRRSAR